jgi:putative endonuclease
MTAEGSAILGVVKGVWFVYLVRCTDGSLYCGIARDVAARIAQHDAGKGAKYTRGRGPVALVAKRRVKTKSDALRLEAAVKREKTTEKLARLRLRIAVPSMGDDVRMGRKERAARRRRGQGDGCGRVRR